MSQFSDSARKVTYISKIPAGTTTKLKYEGMQEKIGEPDQYSNEDGSFGEYSFVGEDGAEFRHTHKSARNAVSIAMSQADVKEGDWFELTRTGSGMETRYQVVKCEAPTKSDEVPFN